MQKEMSDKNYFGEQTVNALSNFGRGQLPFEFIECFAQVKKAAISAINEYENKFTPEIFNSIIKAIDEIIAGNFNDQFIIPLKQGGAGTSINFNFNEVIANLAVKYSRDDYNLDIALDPVEDINLYQSTNDTIPTALTIVVLRKLNILEKLVIELQETLIKKETEFSGVLMTGRTEMQDALPITLGQVFASWAGSIERDRWRINKLKERVRTIALGGTAMGTCFFAPKEYVFLAEKHLRHITNLPLTRSQNLTDEIANLDKYSEAANGISLVAENLFKITGDLLLYTSSFIGEIKHPILQYGSTIMAAKVNPVILEFVRGLSIDIQFEAKKISAYTQNGVLQLNPYIPFIIECFINAFSDLEKAIKALIEKFLNKMSVDNDKILSNLLSSKALLNSLVALVGYNKVKEIENILENKKPKDFDELKQIIIDKTLLGKDIVDDFFNPLKITGFYCGDKK